jgi:hypothetical protein
MRCSWTRSIYSPLIIFFSPSFSFVAHLLYYRHNTDYGMNQTTLYICFIFYEKQCRSVINNSVNKRTHNRSRKSLTEIFTIGDYKQADPSSRAV